MVLLCCKVFAPTVSTTPKRRRGGGAYLLHGAVNKPNQRYCIETKNNEDTNNNKKPPLAINFTSPNSPPPPSFRIGSPPAPTRHEPDSLLERAAHHPTHPARSVRQRPVALHLASLRPEQPTVGAVLPLFFLLGAASGVCRWQRWGARPAIRPAGCGSCCSGCCGCCGCRCGGGGGLLHAHLDAVYDPPENVRVSGLSLGVDQQLPRPLRGVGSGNNGAIARGKMHSL